jgi:hypothetical protein
MTIGMQGSWTVSVKSKSAAWAQRFRIEGSTNGADGVYTGDVSTPPVFVSGSQWGVTVEHNPSGPVSWTPSRHKLGNYAISGGQFRFDIMSDDGGGTDEDFNDLVLTCSMTLSASEYVVYGTVKTYTGFCLFNPCYPIWYYVIDTLPQLKQLLAYPPARRAIEKLYPERVKAVVKRPFPEPDPGPFRPMMLPTGLMDEPSLQVQMSPRSLQGDQPTTSLALSANASTSLLNREDLLAIARVKDSLHLAPCVVTPVSETILRFIEYDRTDAEKLGDPYTGEGNRQVLGLGATDEFGSYVFRFSQDLAQLGEEFSDVAVGEDLATQLRPDVILQIMESLPEGVAYESAPYYNILNVKRIDLCLPQSAVGRPPTACQGGRAIQAIGDLFIVPNPGTTLHGDGTISNTSTSGPHVDHAAWTGVLDLYACFIDSNPAVVYYTLSYKRDGESDFSFVTESYSHLKKQADGTWLNTQVGPIAYHELRINGPANPKVLVNSYLNIESDPGWLFTHRDRKAQLNSAIYQPVSGGVWFKIEGYAADGEKVTGAEDSVYLLIDNHPATGLIDYVKLGTEDPGECALFDLPAAGSPLTVRYKVTDVEGFMAEYSLYVYRGSNTFVPTRDTATLNPVAFSYQPVAPFRFRGTLDQTLDPDGYVEIQLEPTGGAWLPPDKNFCAFDFELSTRNRVTDGKSIPSTYLLWRELIGISYNPPAP